MTTFDSLPKKESQIPHEALAMRIVLAIFLFISMQSEAQTELRIGQDRDSFTDTYAVQSGHNWNISSMDAGCICTILQSTATIPQGRLVALPMLPDHWHLSIASVENGIGPTYVGGKFPFIVIAGNEGTSVHVECQAGHYLTVYDIKR
ncbi:MAG: hypothetical protein IPO87_11965 [Flavobacteriales bacterium]|mgnify:CR=1 FL=1|nr:hypothetical protein [Flavobacteriales bacterium]